ncbi:uncharacterized protein LOC114642026 [Erpetoichthys calabaricus]|uniref:uncharacterized protein LOC114642026 n=1 Tax=Erpetoichthys calabaricus TaxID=27687 RepID=UPI002234957A|nr:uncharacterized protein LOC114642026 [Erpetoichthys calabaricus]
MEVFSLLNMLLLMYFTVMMWFSQSRATVTKNPVPPETEVLFQCSLSGNDMMWRWTPKYPLCTDPQDLSKDKIILIASGVDGRHVNEKRFKNRLTVNEYANGTHALVLSDSIVSDSGRFICANVKEEKESYDLEVLPGCYKGVDISSRHSLSKLRSRDKIQFSCTPCDKTTTDTYKWKLNRQIPDGEEGISWTTTTLTINKMTEDTEGKLECISKKNSSLTSEICLQMDSSTNKNDLNKKTTPYYPINIDAGDMGKKEDMSKVTLLSVVITITAFCIICALLLGVWFYKRIKLKRSKQAYGSREKEREGVRQEPTLDKAPDQYTHLHGPIKISIQSKPQVFGDVGVKLEFL